MHLNIVRCTCTLDTDSPEVHVYSLSDEVDAEEALATGLAPDTRTKMVLARSLQRAGALLAGETLERAWASTLVALQARSEALFPVPPAEEGRGGRGARGRRGGRGRGRARGGG